MTRRKAIQVFGSALAAANHATGQVSSIRIGNAQLDVQLRGELDNLASPELMAWVGQCANSVAWYFGRFPVPHARLTIVVREGGRGVAGGRTWGEPEAHTRIAIGQRTEAADLAHDWVLTHEFVHYGFPDVPDRNHWMEEGMATYVEPIARVAVGTQTATTAWYEMLRDMPQGEPRAGDEGLDRTHTWGRTYWGGALFCLLADVEIHRRTSNSKGLRDAFRAIVEQGGNIEVSWPVERAFEIGDRAVGGSVLMDLYRQMSAKAVPVELPGLWAKLGVERRGETVVFNDHAPLAAVRKAILS